VVGAATAIAGRRKPQRLVRVIAAFAATESATTAKVVRRAPRTAVSVATDAVVRMRAITLVPLTATQPVSVATAFVRRANPIKFAPRTAPIRRPIAAMATAALANTPCLARQIARTAVMVTARAQRQSSAA